jgi:probable HAF family extracellular repeat protein
MEAELRALMTTVDVPPTKADVGRAIATGRRRSRRQAVFGAAAAVLVVTGSFAAVQQFTKGSAPVPIPAAPPSAAKAPPPGCDVETYASNGSVNAVDDSGQYLVGAVYTGNTPSPVRWRDGKPTPLNGTTGTPTAVNGSGVVVGFDSNDQDQYQGWVWHDGQMTRLGKAAGYKWTMPMAINARGDIVGYAMGDALDVNTPVLWRADRPGTAVKLKLPSGVGVSGVGMSRATGIGDDGTIVGVAKGAPVRWRPDGTGSALPLPSANNNGGYVNTIRGHFAVGVFYGKGFVHLVRWDLTAATVTSLGSDSGGLLSGTADGGMVTWGDDKDPAARITPDGHRIPLTQPDAGAAIATAVTADGTTIVGFTAGTTHHPLVWHC